MGLSLLRERYRVDLAGLQATCEANYARLMRLLPDMRETRASRRVALSEGERLIGVLALEVTEACPYTTTLQVRQEAGAALAAGAAPGGTGLPRCADGRGDRCRAGAPADGDLSLPEPGDAPAGREEPGSTCSLANGSPTAWPAATKWSRWPSVERLKAKGQLNDIKPKVVLATVICSAFRVCRLFRRSP